jgi:hypothetical protein
MDRAADEGRNCDGILGPQMNADPTTARPNPWRRPAKSFCQGRSGGHKGRDPVSSLCSVPSSLRKSLSTGRRADLDRVQRGICVHLRQMQLQLQSRLPLPLPFLRLSAARKRRGRSAFSRQPPSRAPSRPRRRLAPNRNPLPPSRYPPTHYPAACMASRGPTIACPRFCPPARQDDRRGSGLLT